jgi:Co/Zn/Cd efflux system component
MKNILTYLHKVIASNTGVSSLSFIMVVVGLISVLLLIVICICMLIEVYYTHTITASLEGYAAMIGAIAGLITSVGLPKALNNYGEHKYKENTER